MTSTAKKTTRRPARFESAKLQNRLKKIQSNWQVCDRIERLVLAKARQLQLCKLAGILAS